MNTDADKNTGAGLRERQKQERFNRIIGAATSQFAVQGIDSTTMANIAREAGVSTPTVFNYFPSKDELLLALVVDVHHQTREKVSRLVPQDYPNRAGAVAGFLGMYTTMSLAKISRAIWRHVEASCIRIPKSNFVKSYNALTDEMLGDFQNFLEQSFGSEDQIASEHLDLLGQFIFYHWSALFVELIRNDSISEEKHLAQLHKDFQNFLDLSGLR